MSEFSPFPKIFHLGTAGVEDILDGKIEITEKIDGSQFAFGIINKELVCRSKGKMQFINGCDKMFTLAVEYVHTIFDTIDYIAPSGTIFYCEFLRSAKHNTLHYGRIPQNNLMLFGVKYKNGAFESRFSKLQEYAKQLNIETVPLLFQGEIENPDPEAVIEMINSESHLGNAQMEGVVIKSYEPWLFGTIPFPLKGAKYVSEKFKEVNKTNPIHNKGSKWDAFKERYRTEARWLKAVQHLRERGDLLEDPKDIGKLITEVKADIVEEERGAILDFLWRQFSEELLRKAVAGLPEWYKHYLATNNYSNEKVDV